MKKRERVRTEMFLWVSFSLGWFLRILLIICNNPLIYLLCQIPPIGTTTASTKQSTSWLGSNTSLCRVRPRMVCPKHCGASLHRLRLLQQRLLQPVADVGRWRHRDGLVLREHGGVPPVTHPARYVQRAHRVHQ